MSSKKSKQLESSKDKLLKETSLGDIPAKAEGSFKVPQEVLIGFLKI
jgi:hypothetical protein